jgi:hypothetical protein
MYTFEPTMFQVSDGGAGADTGSAPAAAAGAPPLAAQKGKTVATALVFSELLIRIQQGLTCTPPYTWPLSFQDRLELTRRGIIVVQVAVCRDRVLYARCGGRDTSIPMW